MQRLPSLHWSNFFASLGRHYPVIISGTITDASGRTLSGQTLEAFINSVGHMDVLALGLNCGLGAKEMRPYLEELSGKTHHYVSVYPNAGFPNQFGEYDQGPEEMAAYLKDFTDHQFVNIIGGCCGTTPEHIREFRKSCRQRRPQDSSGRKQGFETQRTGSPFHFSRK